MKSFVIFVLIFLSIFNLACKKSNSPTEPNELKQPVSLAEYGSSIDENYYKVWSDSTWECFDRTITINRIFYATIVDCYGDEYYYSADGYAGFKLYGDSLILFDQPMPSLPDTINYNQDYVQSVTFTYQGNKFTMQNEQTLLDTSSVPVSFGTFSCLWFEAKSTLTSGNQFQVSNSQFWLAKGPAAIKEIINSDDAIYMIEGVVNGKGYGSSTPKLIANNREIQNQQFVKKPYKSLLKILRPEFSLKLRR
jgi:hypothetical protein